MEIFVTGGAGFIGSHLCEELIRQKIHVVCVDNFNDYYNPLIKKRNIENLLQQDGFELIEADILDFAAMKKIYLEHSFAAVVHLAARAGVRPSIQQPLLYEEVNVKGTTNLLELTRQFKVPKFILASSSSVYGNNKRVPFHESDNVDYPVSPYAATKKACELIAYTYFHLYQISISCIRFFTVYGPRQRPDMAIHKFTRLIDQGAPIPVFGDGSTKRDYTFISDIVDGLLSALASCSGYEIYNFGDSRTINLMEMIQTIEKYLEMKAILQYLPPQPGDVEITFADINKAQQKLNYQPKIYFDDGIRLFCEWFKRNQKL